MQLKIDIDTDFEALSGLALIQRLDFSQHQIIKIDINNTLYEYKCKYVGKFLRIEIREAKLWELED